MDIHREATDLIRKYRIELSVEHRDFLVSACLNAFKEVNQGKHLKKNLYRSLSNFPLLRGIKIYVFYNSAYKVLNDNKCTVHAYIVI